VTLPISATRALFPAAEAVIYLDAGLQSPLCRPVKEALEAYIASSYATAGPKADWLAAAEATRGKLAAFVGADPADIAFCKNTSEAMNIAANALPLGPGDTVLMLEGDHPNNAYAFLNLGRRGVTTRFVPMTEWVTGETFRPHLDPSVKAISLSLVTFHAGHRFDVESVGRLCAEVGVHLVVDVMQGIGVTPVDVKRLHATFVGSGTHKGLLVPHGLGFLYWNRDRLPDVAPPFLAAASLAAPPADFIARHDNLAVAPSARRFEIGNYNLPALMALGAALDLIAAVGVEAIEAHCQVLGDRLIAGLDAEGVGLAGPRERAHRAPHIYVARLPAGDWLPWFEARGIRVSPERDGVRVSFGMFSTEADVDAFLAAVRARQAADA
jgi:selenocysteine lyase/cysteine desulfurase